MFFPRPGETNATTQVKVVEVEVGRSGQPASNVTTESLDLNQAVVRDYGLRCPVKQV